MPVFRIERELPTGWRVRLDYRTHDNSGYNPDGAVTAIDSLALITLGEHLNEFDSLPYGLQQPSTLKLTLAWSLLPTALTNYLRDGRDPVTQKWPNVFYFWTDRGTTKATGTTSWSLEFAGCEDDTEGVDYNPEGTDVYTYDVELVDVLYYMLKSTTGYRALIATSINNNLVRTTYKPYYKYWNWYISDQRGKNSYQEAPANSVTMYDAESLLKEILYQIAFISSAYGGLSGDFSGLLWLIGTNAAMLTAMGYLGLSDFTNIMTTACKFRASTTTAPRSVIGLDLTKNDLQIIAKIKARIGNSDYESAGGMLGQYDEYGFAKSDLSMWDVLRGLAETFGVKMSYSWNYSTVPGSTGVHYAFNVRRIGTPITESDDNATQLYDVRLGANNMLERPKIGKRQDNIAKAETRWQSARSENSNEIIRVQRGARGSRSMNIEPVMHNCPVFQPEEDSTDGFYGPLVQTNLLWTKLDGNSALRCHENMTIQYMPDTGTLPGGAGAYASVSTTAADEPRIAGDDMNGQTVQVNAVQLQSCLPACLAKLHLHLWSHPDNAVVETSWGIDQTKEALPNKLGAVHDLSFAEDGGNGGASQFASLFDRLAWSRAILTSSAVDYMAGTVKVKYFLLAQTGNAT